MRTTAKKEGPPTVRKDPLDITPRLYSQLGRLLDDMEAADRDEKMTMPQRISAMIALGRVMKMMQDLMKSQSYAGAGSTVNKYAAAFASPDAVGGRVANARPSAPVEPDRSEPDDWDDDERDDAA